MVLNPKFDNIQNAVRYYGRVDKRKSKNMEMSITDEFYEGEIDFEYRKQNLLIISVSRKERVWRKIIS